MRQLCELCRRVALEPIYKPESSVRRLTVYVCGYCGLVQSLPHKTLGSPGSIGTSSEPDEGNVRAEIIRAELAVDAIARNGNLDRTLSVLDVGARRGSFARWILARATRASLIAVEPDERFAVGYSDLDRGRFIASRIEDLSFDSEHFDVVHSGHTLQSLMRPSWSLGDHWRVLKPGGLLVLDTPNMATIARDTAGEWFSDCRFYHFSARSLARMVESVGFTLLERPDPGESENLFFVAQKTARSASFVERDAQEVDEAKALIAAYVAARARKLATLPAVAASVAVPANHPARQVA